jgi:hypothetical protein
MHVLDQQSARAIGSAWIGERSARIGYLVDRTRSWIAIGSGDWICGEQRESGMDTIGSVIQIGH